MNNLENYKVLNSEKSYYDFEGVVEFAHSTNFKGEMMRKIKLAGYERVFFVFENAVSGILKSGTKAKFTAYDKDEHVNVVQVVGDEDPNMNTLIQASKLGIGLQLK